MKPLEKCKHKIRHGKFCASQDAVPHMHKISLSTNIWQNDDYQKRNVPESKNNHLPTKQRKCRIPWNPDWSCNIPSLIVGSPRYSFWSWWLPSQPPHHCHHTGTCRGHCHAHICKNKLQNLSCSPPMLSYLATKGHPWRILGKEDNILGLANCTPRENVQPHHHQECQDYHFYTWWKQKGVWKTNAPQQSPFLCTQRNRKSAKPFLPMPKSIFKTKMVNTGLSNVFGIDLIMNAYCKWKWIPKAKQAWKWWKHTSMMHSTNSKSKINIHPIDMSLASML